MKRIDTFSKLLVIFVILVVLLITVLVTTLNKVRDDMVPGVKDTRISRGLNSKISKEDRQKIEKYQTDTSNIYIRMLDTEKRKTLIDIIDEVLEAINKKDYSLLYSKLDADYKKTYFPTQKDFEKYFDTATHNYNDYTCEYYDVTPNQIRCVLISEAQGERFEIKIVTASDYSDYTLYFRSDYKSSREKVNETFYFEKIIGDIKYEIVCENTQEYIVELKNKTNQNVTCDFSDSTLEYTMYGTTESYNLIAPAEPIELKPNETKKTTLVFDTSTLEMFTPTHLNIINNKKEETHIYIDPMEDDIDV